MNENLLIFLAWVAFILIGQTTKGRKREKKKLPQVFSKIKKRMTLSTGEKAKQDSFSCEMARESNKKPAPLHPDLVQDLQPVHSDLKKEVKEDLQVLRPTVVEESKQEKRQQPSHRRLQGSLKEGVLWTMVLGRPRSQVSWRQEMKQYGSVRKQGEARG